MPAESVVAPPKVLAPASVAEPLVRVKAAPGAADDAGGSFVQRGAAPLTVTLEPFSEPLRLSVPPLTNVLPV